MPKMKPHKGLKKRVKVTATGKIVYKRAGLGHLLSDKPGTRKIRLRRKGVLTGPLAAKYRVALVEN